MARYEFVVGIESEESLVGTALGAGVIRVLYRDDAGAAVATTFPGVHLVSFSVSTEPARDASGIGEEG